MSHLKQKHKEYLIKNDIKDLVDLTNYLEILKTSELKEEDRQMLFDFAWLLINDSTSLTVFFIENKGAQAEIKNTPFYMDEVINSLNYKSNSTAIDSNKNPFEHLKNKNVSEDLVKGVKESQTTKKAPVFTYCKVNKNALEALSLRALYGHEKYEEHDSDWQNFTRVPDAEFEYSNALFRHALEIGGDETEEEHLIASAWNAIANLEIFLRKKKNKFGY